MPATITTVDAHYVGEQVAASHLIIDNGRAAFVDCGIASSVPKLLAALERAGLAPEQVDWICPTHVHLDHAGGAGQLMQRCPNATCVIHPRGARHLIEPSKLIAGSVAVYGEQRFAEIYGEILSIDEQRVRIAEDGDSVPLGASELAFIHTEGHARHHYCVVHHELGAILSGDTLGLAYPWFTTTKGPFVCASTTPVQFDPPAWFDSLSRIEAMDLRAAYLTHFGLVEDLTALFHQLRQSLTDFVALAQAHANSANRTTQMERALFQLLSRRLDEHGDEHSEEERRRLLAMDVELNVMGLEVWLDRQRSNALG